MAAPNITSATWITDGIHDGVVLRTVWDIAAANGANTPTFSCAARGITNAAMVYKTGFSTNTIDWFINDANLRVRAGDVVTWSATDVVRQLGTPNTTVTNGATTNSSTAAAPAINYGSRSFKVFSNLFGNGASVSFGGLGVQAAYNFSYAAGEADTLAHFQTAAAAKFPANDVPAVATLDVESLLATTVTGNYSDYVYGTNASWPTNRAIITSMLAWGKANYPHISFGLYQQPNQYSDIVPASGASERASRTTYASMAHAHVELLAYCDNIQPETYIRDATFTQSLVNDFCDQNVLIARTVNDLVMPRTARPIYLFFYLNLPETPYTDLTMAMLYSCFIGAQRAGADGLIFSASESLKTGAQWQTDANTRMTQSLGAAGLVPGWGAAVTAYNQSVLSNFANKTMRARPVMMGGRR